MELDEDMNIPIYPRAGDLVLLMNSLVDVIGKGSGGILYNFGKQLAERCLLYTSPSPRDS